MSSTRRSSLLRSSIGSFFASSRRDESPVTREVVMVAASDSDSDAPAAAASSSIARRPMRAAATAALTALHKMRDKEDVDDAEERKSSPTSASSDESLLAGDDVPLLHLLTPRKRRRVASADSTSSDSDHEVDSDYDGEDARLKSVSLPTRKRLFGSKRQSRDGDDSSDDGEERKSEVKKTTKQKGKLAAATPPPPSPLMAELISRIQSDAPSHLRILATCTLLELPDSDGVIDLNHRSAQTGDTLLQSIYALAQVRCESHVSMGAGLSLTEHKAQLVRLIEAANLRLRNHAGQNILHTICQTKPSEWMTTRNRLFETVLERCLKCRMSLMLADSAGRVPLVDLARLVSQGKFKVSRFERILVTLQHHVDLSVADANGDRAAHLICVLPPAFAWRDLRDLGSMMQMILSRSHLLMQMDLYEQTASGQTVIDILRAGCSRSPAWGHAPWSLSSLPRRLEDQFCVLAKPAYKRGVTDHLIPDLADIVVSYLVPDDPTRAQSGVVKTSTPAASDLA